ncbi:MAG TPA: hypothetical protein VFS43_00260 [Polyangiaceae bacterium]|nr:hypothetical protein [Polyangiaceae bacterium]
MPLASPAPDRGPAVAALRAQLAAAARTLPAVVDGRDGRPAAPQEAVASLLAWAGDDVAKLRRALRRVLELAAPPRPAGHAPPPGPVVVAAPRARPRGRPPASAFDPEPGKRHRRP